MPNGGGMTQTKMTATRAERVAPDAGAATVSSQRGRGRRGDWIGIWPRLGLGLGMILVAGSGSAHTTSTSIPPDSSYLIRWYQPHGARPVNNWEIEITKQRSPSPYIASAQVMPDASCWALNVPVNEPASVRIRSVAGSQVSAWSRKTTVPEVGLGVGTLSASGFLAALARGRQRRISPKKR
jgi:hypothetical protein